MSKVISDFLAGGGSPFKADHLGEGHRCSVELVDGTVLPCVMLRKPETILALAERRIAEEGRGKGVFSKSANPSREMLAHFLTKGNRVNAYDIKSVTPSIYAMPLTLLEQITGETLMSWTGFVLTMSDGHSFSYGTTFLFQFFNLPSGYTFEEVKTVHNHAYVDETGAIRHIREDAEKWRASLNCLPVFREKPFFDCFLGST